MDEGQIVELQLARKQLVEAIWFVSFGFYLKKICCLKCIGPFNGQKWFLQIKWSQESPIFQRCNSKKLSIIKIEHLNRNEPKVEEAWGEVALRLTPTSKIFIKMFPLNPKGRKSKEFFLFLQFFKQLLIFPQIWWSLFIPTLPYISPLPCPTTLAGSLTVLMSGWK